MKILVTGAAGRLGRVVCTQLLDAGHEVLGTDKVGWDEAPMPFVQADLLDFSAVGPLMEACEAVVQLGNYPGLRTCPDARQLYLDNSAMTANVVLAAQAAGVERIVYASSVQVISGTRRGLDEMSLPSCFETLPLDGDTPPKPGNLYALSKLAGEELLRCQCRCQPSLSAVAVRFPMLLTPSQQESMLAHWTPMGSSYGPLPLDEGCAWLSFPDGARLVEALLRRAQPGFRVIMPAAPTPWGGCTLAELIARLYPDVPLRQPLSELTGLVDISSITRDYGWEPTVAP